MSLSPDVCKIKNFRLEYFYATRSVIGLIDCGPRWREIKVSYTSAVNAQNKFLLAKTPKSASPWHCHPALCKIKKMLHEFENDSSIGKCHKIVGTISLCSGGAGNISKSKGTWKSRSADDTTCKSVRQYLTSFSLVWVNIHLFYPTL